MKHIDLMDALESKSHEVDKLQLKLQQTFAKSSSQCFTEEDARYYIIHPLMHVLSDLFPDTNKVCIRNEHSMGAKSMNMTNAHGKGRIDICLGPENSSKYLTQIYLVVEAKLKSDQNDYPQVIGELACSFFYNKLMSLNSPVEGRENFVTYALLMDGTGRFVMFVAKQRNDQMQLLHSDELSFVWWDDTNKKYELGNHFLECCQILAAIVSSTDLPLLYENHVAAEREQKKAAEARAASLEQENSKLAEKNSKLEEQNARLQALVASYQPNAGAISLQQMEKEESGRKRKREEDSSDENPSKILKF